MKGLGLKRGSEPSRPCRPTFIWEKILTGNLDYLIVDPQVQLIGWMEFDSELAEYLTGWETDADGGQALAEFAGRACYQSWSKPNPATATNFGYLRHIIDMEHLSVLEHGVASFYLTGVSRSFGYEIIRHRHTSKSQLSQRYVPVEDLEEGDPQYGVIIPPAYRGRRSQTHAVLVDYIGALGTYNALVEADLREAEQAGKPKKLKEAREAARSVLPNCAETRIVITGNFLAWRELIAKRATVHADAEMREVTVMIAKVLKARFPSAFQDMQIRIECEAGFEVVEFALLD